MPSVSANGLMLEVERHGDPAKPVILMIRGLGSQLIQWPERLIDGWVADGFHVVTFDNRDAGLSQKCPEGGYTLTDMADDTRSVMDALRIDRAHVFGMSMGGIITQILARTAPGRVQTATIVMSTSGAPDLPGVSAEGQARLQSAPAAQDRDSVVEHTLDNDAFWGSPGFPFDPTARADLIARCYDRCYCPEGAARQLSALLAEQDQSHHLPHLNVPMLVIHGSDDALIPVVAGRDIADRSPNAEFLEIAGMGHDLEGAAVDQIRHAVRMFITGRG